MKDPNTIRIRSANLPFIVACNQCRREFLNWPGSTPCCGSIAYESASGDQARAHPLYLASVEKGNDPETEIYA